MVEEGRNVTLMYYVIPRISSLIIIMFAKCHEKGLIKIYWHISIFAYGLIAAISCQPHHNSFTATNHNTGDPAHTILFSSIDS